MSELQDLVDGLAARLGRAATIDDQRFHLVAFSSHGNDIDDVRLASILHREAPAAVQDRLLAAGIDHATAPVRVPADGELGMRARWCVPVRFEGMLFGWLWLVDEPEPLDDAQLDDAVACATEAAPLLYRERMLDDEGRARERRLVAALLGADAMLRREAADVVAADGLLMDSVDGCVALAVAGDDAAGVVAALERVRRALPPHACLVGDAALVMAGAGGAPTDAAIARAVGQERVVARGPVVERLEDVATSYAAACDALAVAPVLPIDQVDGTIIDYERLGAWRLLARIPRDAATAAAIPAPLRALAERADGPQLLQTLETFLDNGGDIPRTAGELFVHRTSLYARLRRIERDTGADLADGAQRLDLHLGLRLLRLTG